MQGCTVPILPELPPMRTVIGCHRFLTYDWSAWWVVRVRAARECDFPDFRIVTGLDSITCPVPFGIGKFVNKNNGDFFGPTSNCSHSETVCPNHFKFSAQVGPTMDPYGLKFQVIWTNDSRVIAVGSWAEKICPPYC